MRIAGNTQSGIIAAQLLTPSSAQQGRTTHAGFGTRDVVTFSDRARTAITEIVRLADKANVGKPDRADVAVASISQPANRPAVPSGLNASASPDVEAMRASPLAERLRAGQDGHAQIIEGLEDTLRVLKENLGFARETIKIYEETGEFWSVQSAGKVQFDVIEFGGVEKYVKAIHSQIEGTEKLAIPEIERSLSEAHASRLQVLREYGLASPVVDNVV